MAYEMTGRRQTTSTMKDIRGHGRKQKSDVLLRGRWNKVKTVSKITILKGAERRADIHAG